MYQTLVIDGGMLVFPFQLSVTLPAASSRPMDFRRTFMEAILLEMERSMNLSPICTVKPPTRAGLTSVLRTMVWVAPICARNDTRRVITAHLGLNICQKLRSTVKLCHHTPENTLYPRLP